MPTTAIINNDKDVKSIIPHDNDNANAGADIQTMGNADLVSNNAKVSKILPVFETNSGCCLQIDIIFKLIYF